MNKELEKEIELLKKLPYVTSVKLVESRNPKKPYLRVGVKLPKYVMFQEDGCYEEGPFEVLKRDRSRTVKFYIPLEPSWTFPVLYDDPEESSTVFPHGEGWYYNDEMIPIDEPNFKIEGNENLRAVGVCNELVDRLLTRFCEKRAAKNIYGLITGLYELGMKQGNAPDGAYFGFTRVKTELSFEEASELLKKKSKKRKKVESA